MSACKRTGRKVCAHKRLSVVWADPKFSNEVKSSEDKGVLSATAGGQLLEFGLSEF